MEPEEILIHRFRNLLPAHPSANDTFQNDQHFLLNGQVAMGNSHDDFAKAQREAREYVTGLLGVEPKGDAVWQGFVAFLFSAAVPHLGLLLFGFQKEAIETPLFIIGAVCGLCVWRYHKHCEDKWYRAVIQREDDLMRERDRQDEYKPDEWSRGLLQALADRNRDKNANP